MVDRKMIRPFPHIVYDCKQATLLSIKREEGKITLFERTKLTYHLLYCGPCRRFIEQWYGLKRKSAGLLAAKPPFSIPSEVRDRIQKQMDLMNL